MKKMIYLFILVFSLSTLVACSDDEGTPVFTEPTEFVLNVPKYASGIYDLKNTATIQLTCSQPDYGFTAATRYTVEIALDQAFEKKCDSGHQVFNSQNGSGRTRSCCRYFQFIRSK